MKIPTRNRGSLGFVLFRALAVAVIIAMGVTLRTSAQEQSQAVPPPSAPPQLSESDLEKLAEPIALYPDPLLAVMLPASVYPLEIVQAARFVQDTNNIPLLDNQPWDENVIAVAKYPTVIQKMNDDLQWTIQLGNAFADQPADLMNAIQTLRAKAQAAGTLQSTPQQVIIVTNAVVERYFESQIVYVTNTVVEIQPANPQIIYVPVYNPAYVFYPPPGYVYNPVFVSLYWGPRVTPYRVNWWYGGIYVGGGGGMIVWGGRGPRHPPYFPPPPGFRPPPFRPPPGYRPPPPGSRPPGFPPPGNRPPGNRPPGNQPPGNRPPGNPPPGNGPPGQRPPGPGGPPSGDNTQWRPDPNRRQNAGSGGTRETRQSRGWGSGAPSTQPAPGSGTVNTRPATETSGNRPNTGTVGNRPSAGTPGNNPSTGNQGSRPNNRTPGNNPSTGGGGNRPASGNAPPNSRPATPPANNQPATRPGTPSNSAFNRSGNGDDVRSSSNRGAASRGGGGGGGGNRGGGGSRGGGR